LPADTHLLTYPQVGPWNNPKTAPHTVAALADPEPDAAAAEAFLAFLRRHPQITAIFGVNDANALHAWRALHHAGYRVPADYSLVGFDDTDPLRDEAGPNLLASIRVPLAEIGQAAAHLAVRLVHAPASTPATQILPVEFIPRASVGPARGG
jgi:LacI family transcriptional regulator